ncbi:hypothetical protein [Halorussus caseinilyticus]|uniref:Uncharacterized protein n=1 Tax=Halorussus caseinilyticus TaxID=3034025 RepID=A0ABD5WJ88_9EURY|nr:hypothetical protein [Halorussus sp. DT72]
MGILEIHFHDSEFSWSVNPDGGEKQSRSRSLSLGSGSESDASTDGGQSDRPSIAPKLRSFAILALVVGAGIAYNRLRSQRARKAAAEEESVGGRLSRIRSR